MGSKGGESWNSDEKQELEWPWMAPFVCSCLSAFIRVHPRLFLLVCLGSGGRKEKKWGYELEFCGGGFWTGSGLYGDRGAGAGGAAGQVRLRGAGVRENGGAAAAVPGADSAGDSVDEHSTGRCGADVQTVE